MIGHYSSAQKKAPLLPARRFAAGGEKRGPARVPPVSAKSLAPPRQAGWGPDTDKPSIDKPIAKTMALSN